MRRWLLLTFALLLIAAPSHAGLVQVDGDNTFFSSGGSSKTQNLTVTAGTDLLMIVHVTANSQQNTIQYPTAVKWTVSGDQALTRVAEKRNSRDSLQAYASTWILIAPATGAGTVTVTYDVSAASNATAIAVETWSGAHQTDPCPAADVVQQDTDENPSTATPTNLVAGNATSAIAAASDGGGLSAISGNIMVFNGNGTLQSGGAWDVDTTGITFTASASNWHKDHAITAVRIVPSASTQSQAPRSDDQFRFRKD